MARKTGSRNSRNTQKVEKTKRGNGNRYILSARAETVLKTVLEDILQETLQDAKRIAEQTEKGRISLNEVEKALKKLCNRYCPQFGQFQKDVSKSNRKSK